MARRPLALALAHLLALGAASAAAEEQAWDAEQRGVVRAIAELSAATAPGGGGAEAYGRLLAEEFRRWTLGSDSLDDKASWLAGIRDWFDAGWRVTDRDSRYLEVAVHGEIATTRRIVRESYLGPAGERSTSTAAVAETWVRRAGGWLLLRADVRPLDPS